MLLVSTHPLSAQQTVAALTTASASLPPKYPTWSLEESIHDWVVELLIFKWAILGVGLVRQKHREASGVEVA